jgi:hypothetical protein
VARVPEAALHLRALTPREGPQPRLEGTGRARAAVRVVRPRAEAGALAPAVEGEGRAAPGEAAARRLEAERTGVMPWFVNFASIGASLPYTPWRTMLQACLTSPFDEDLTWLK